jgi:phosphohistidine phosphatase
MEAEALGMQRIGLVLDLLLTSPLVRAAQTAAIVGRVLGVVPQVESLLAAGMGMQQFMQILDHVRVQRVMVVGHEPDFSYIIGALTGGSQIEMKKGSLALVELMPRYDGDGVLHWLLPPKHLQVLGGR